MMRFIDPHHRKLVHEPHGYLWVLGVAPAVQGRCIGSDFLTPVLHRADADGVLCYVETQSEANVAFYEHCSCDVVLTAAELVCRFSLWFAYPVVPRPPRRCGGGESVLAPGETDKLKPHLSQEGRGRREENWGCRLAPWRSASLREIDLRVTDGACHTAIRLREAPYIPWRPL